MSKNRYYANPVYHQDRLTFRIDPFEFVTTTGVFQYGGGAVAVTDNSNGYVIVDKTTGVAAYTTTAGTANKIYLVKTASAGGTANVVTYFDNAPFDADGSGGSGLGEKPAVSVAYAASITPDIDSYGTFNVGTLTGAPTIENPSGTPTDRQPATFRFVQDGTGRVISWGTSYAFGTDITSGDIPSTASAKFEVSFRYHSGDSKWRCVGLIRGF